MKPAEIPSFRNGRDGTGRLPLLLESSLDLRTGHVHVDQTVGERLDLGGLLVGQGPRVRVAHGASTEHVGPQTTRVHEPDLRAAPNSGADIRHRCASATRLPSEDSAPRFSVVPFAR